MTDTIVAVQIRDLTPLQLNWFVSQAIGFKTYGPMDFREHSRFDDSVKWCKNWGVGGPLISQYRITLIDRGDDTWGAAINGYAPAMHKEPLMAAMMALVKVNVVGFTVLVPQELL
jgi:hypothetical protein